MVIMYYLSYLNYNNTIWHTKSFQNWVGSQNSSFNMATQFLSTENKDIPCIQPGISHKIVHLLGLQFWSPLCMLNVMYPILVFGATNSQHEYIKYLAPFGSQSNPWSYEYPLANVIMVIALYKHHKASANHEASQFLSIFTSFGCLRNIFPPRRWNTNFWDY